MQRLAFMMRIKPGTKTSNSDTLPGRKSRSFCLSRVVGTLRNAAWPRLGAYRSEQGKAREQRIHACICFLGGAMPVAGSMPCAKGRMAHNLRLASWEPGTPASFDAAPLGTYPQGRRLFLSYCLMALHFLKPMRDSRSYLRSAFNSLYIWKNTVVFLRLALRHTTRTRFSFQGARESIAH